MTSQTMIRWETKKRIWIISAGCRWHWLPAVDYSPEFTWACYWGWWSIEWLSIEWLNECERKGCGFGKVLENATEAIETACDCYDCRKCSGAGWLWFDELDNRAGHGPTELVIDDTRYPCDACERCDICGRRSQTNQK